MLDHGSERLPGLFLEIPRLQYNIRVLMSLSGRTDHTEDPNGMMRALRRVMLRLRYVTVDIPALKCLPRLRTTIAPRLALSTIKAEGSCP